MYSAHNELNSAVAERFIRTLKNKICKYMISGSKNLYIDKSDDIVGKYNNVYHSTTKMKPADLKPSNILTLAEKLIIKILNFKLLIFLEYKNVKIFLQRFALQIYLKKF